jgi:hypothetical protein
MTLTNLTCLGLLCFSRLATPVGPAAGAVRPLTMTCFGMCDASAVVPLNQDLFLVGDDEDNYLRVYSRQTGGQPVFITNVSRFLGFKKSSGETDIEDAARIGEHVFWISSHGRNAKAKLQPRRQRFFATTAAIAGDGSIEVHPVGYFYSGLLRDLARDPRLVAFNLGRAARGAPKAPGALNIEGLAGTPEGHLLIGFRNPIPHGQALIVPMLNPAEVVRGRNAQWGDPVLLDLAGLGIRGMTRWQGVYLILAGSADGAGVSRLYEWRGPGSQPHWRSDVDFAGLNPEAIAPVPDEEGKELIVVSDDGAVLCDGVECKRLKDQSKKRFRLLTLALTPPQSVNTMSHSAGPVAR